MRLVAILAAASLAVMWSPRALATRHHHARTRPAAQSAPPPPSDDDDLELVAPAMPASDLPLPIPEPPPPPKKAEPAPAPAPPPPPPPPPAPPPLGLRLSPTVGFGQVSETTLDTTTPVFSAGFGAAYRFKKTMTVSLDLADRLYERLYATTQPDLAARSEETVRLSEQDLAIDALFAYDLAPLFKLAPGRLQLAPVIGPSVRFFQNEALPSEAGGIAIGARASFRLSEQLEIGGSGSWAYNLFFQNPTLDSALGGPMAVSTLDAYVGLRLAPKTRFSLGYAGEIVTLARSYRLMHTLSFTFDVLL